MPVEFQTECTRYSHKNIILNNQKTTEAQMGETKSISDVKSTKSTGQYNNTIQRKLRIISG